MRKGQWQIHTTEPGKPNQPYVFYTVASSQAEALRYFKKNHKRWRIKSIEPPPFPEEKPKKSKGRKK